MPAARPIRHSLQLLALAAVTLTGIGCSRHEDADAPAWTSLDSAGVEILTSHAPLWGNRSAWVLSPEPALVIGDVSGRAPYLLDGIVGAHRTDDGRVLVCNRADRTIRTYARTGSFVGDAAGEGGGPSELRLMNRCLWRDDETFVYQAPALPLKVYDVEGAFRRSIAIPRIGGRPATLLDVTGGITQLTLWQDDPRASLAQGVSTLFGTLIEYNPASANVDTVGRFPSGRWVRDRRLAFPQAFTPRFQFAMGRSQMVVSWPETFDVAMLADVGVVRRLRWTREPVPVDDALRSEFEHRILDGPMPSGDLPFSGTDVRRRIVDMMVYPPTLPAHHRLLVDRTGHLWFERADHPADPFPDLVEAPLPPTTWDVFAPEGGWLGPVGLPAGFDPLEIGDDYVLGVHRDAMGVEQLEMYALAKPAAEGEGHR